MFDEREIAAVSGSVAAAANLFSQDTAGFDVCSIQWTSIGAGNTWTLEGSNDNTNWVAVLGTNAPANASAGWASSGAPALADLIVVPVLMRYLRLRISAYGSGTAACVAVFRKKRFQAPVKIDAVAPGSGASDLGKAEDAAHASGDVGVQMLAVRTATPADRSGTDGDYEPPQIAGGRQWVSGDPRDVIDVTLTLDTAIYADGDVLSDTATLTNAMRVAAGSGILRSIALVDEDDQGIALDVVFFKATQSLGAKNAAPNITDAAARDILGIISIAMGDYVDLGGVRVATKSGLALALEAAAASQDIFVGTITRGGTPTYTANGIRMKFGIEQG